MLARTLLLPALCWVCVAQVSLQGVVSGYVLDRRSASVRPLLGAPGAAYLGGALALPWGVTAAAVRGSRDIGVAISDEQPRHVYLLHGFAAKVAATPLGAAIADGDRVFLSGDGSAAAIVSSSRRQVQLIANLTSSPAVADPVTLDVRGEITAVAVSDLGCALAAGADERSGQVMELCIAAPGTVVTLLDKDGFHPTAAAWLDNRSFAVSDAASNQVLLFTGSDGSAPTVLLDHTSGIESPVGVAAVDSSTLAVVNTRTAALVVARTDESSPARIFSLPAQPMGIDALDTPSILVSNTLLNSPLLLIDVRRDYAAFFVPAN